MMIQVAIEALKANDDLLLLKHACSKELITGYTDNSFKPFNNMTRAEAATMIYRFM